MADKRDYYEILGVSKTATESEIKSAFRKKAKECHPDLHPGDKAKESQFKELNEAAEILSDADKRAKYDQYGHAAFDPSMGGQDPFAGGGFGGFGDFGDILRPDVRRRFRRIRRRTDAQRPDSGRRSCAIT